MVSLESQTKTQQNPGNAQVIPNQNPPGPGTIHIKCNITPFFCAINVFASKKKECRQDIQGIVKFSTLREFTSHWWNACFLFSLAS